MASNIENCPHCGNVVEGKRSQTYDVKLGKTAAKTAASEVTKAVSTSTGAVVGTALGGPLGTVLGGAAGYIASLVAKERINHGIDSGIDSIRDVEYNYSCPKCGCKWEYSKYEKGVRVITQRGSGPGNSSYGVPRYSSGTSSASSNNAETQKLVLKYIRPCFMTSDRITLDTIIVPYMINKSNLMTKLESSKKYNCYLTRDEITACNTVRELVNLIIRESGN